MLLMMARTAESVGARDQRCAGQMSDVTERLKAIASLDDLSEIRKSIEKSTCELKSSIDRMTAEGKAVLDHLKKLVAPCQIKLEAGGASRDALTWPSQPALWGPVEKRLAAGTPFCIAIVDIDRFKKVNDDHGHVTGDELLKQFSTELRSACRATDVIGRWGGDEFVYDVRLRACGGGEAQVVRLRKWICGSYTVSGMAGGVKLRVDASIGLAERAANDAMKELLARADAAMYEEKAAGRAKVA